MSLEKELQKKKETRRVQDEKSSAIKLQSRYRGYRARRKVKEKVKHLEANEAATIIQSIWRGYITRETYMYVCQIRGERATMIQSAWRSYACRRNLKRSKEELEEIRQEKLAQKSSVLIQSSWRGYVAKLVYNEIKHIRGWGASIIQTWWRRTIANYKFRHAVSSTIKIQHWFRDMLKQKEQAYLDLGITRYCCKNILMTSIDTYELFTGYQTFPNTITLKTEKAQIIHNAR